MTSPPQKLDELSEEFLSIARNTATGTLRVTREEGLSKQFYFFQGNLADLDTGREDTVLEAALLSTQAYSDKDVKRARKAVAKNSPPLVSGPLLEMGILTDEEVGEAIKKRLMDEVCEVFEWPITEIGFLAHEPDERLEDFTSELADIYEVFLDPEDIVLEAARRLERWDLVQKNFGMLSDVFYATPASFKYFRDTDRFSREHAILSKVDGTKDVEEVIAESGCDPFHSVMLVRKLKVQGDVELINPVQMFQLAVECATASNHEKAAKLFSRAHDRGLDDFDLQLKLAQSLEATGQKDNAVRRYLEFAEKCVTQLRPDDAIRTLRRVIKLEPGNLAAQEKHLEVLMQQGHFAESADQALELAQAKLAGGEGRAGLAILLKARELNPRDSKLQQKIIEFAEACGEVQVARTEREAFARSCDQRKDVETALETYQKLFCDGNDTLEVRLKLVELHKARGNRQKAIDHLTAIINSPEKRRTKDEATLVMLHETLRDLKPSDIRANRWLADYYSRTGDKAKAVQVLTTWIGHLERDTDLEEVVHAYEKLIAIDDQHEHRWGLAKVLEKLGKLVECRRELRSLANLALRKKELDQAAKALEYILKTSPLDIETRKMQAELHEAREETGLAARKHEEIAALSVLSGNVQEAEQSCRRLDPNAPDTAEIVRRLARLCLETGDRQKGGEQLLKAAKIHLQQKNYGLCRVAIEDLLRAEPAHGEGAAVLTELKAREAGPPPVVAPPAVRVIETRQAEPVLQAPAPQSAYPGTAIEREPFQSAKPVMTKVSGITARLKRLKSGDTSQPAGSAAPQVQPPRADGAVGVPQAAPAAAGTTSSVQASTALKSAASRLKAMAGKKTQPASGALPPPQSQPAAPVPSLEAVSPTAESVPEGSSAAAPPAAPEAAPPRAPVAPVAPGDSSDASGAQRKLKLATSASKLAQLRKAKAAQTT